MITRQFRSNAYSDLFLGAKCLFEIAEVGMFARQFLSSMTFPTYQQHLSKPDTVALTARTGGHTVDLALVALSGESAELLSVFTHKNNRRSGIGCALVLAATYAAARFGVRRLHASFTDDSLGAVAMRRIFAACGWTAPALQNHIAEAKAADILAQPVMTHLMCEAVRGRLSVDHRITQWNDVSDDLLAKLGARLDGSTDVPSVLNPFLHPEPFAPESPALVMDGEIKGWVLCHWLDQNKVRYALVWFDRDVAGRGAFVPLMQQAILWQLVRVENPVLARGRFTISPQFPAMLRFLKGRLGEALDRLTEVSGVHSDPVALSDSRLPHPGRGK